MAEILCRIVKTPDGEYLVDVNGGLVAAGEDSEIFHELHQRESQVRMDQETTRVLSRINALLSWAPTELKLSEYQVVLTLLFENADNWVTRYVLTDGQQEISYDDKGTDDNVVLFELLQLLAKNPDSLSVEVLGAKLDAHQSWQARGETGNAI